MRASIKITRRLRLGLVALLAGLGIGMADVTQAKEAPTKGFALAEVIAQVKRELAAAQNQPGSAVGLTLQTVGIDLAVGRVSDVDGKITIGVPAVGVEAGGGVGRKADQSSSISVELTPPKAIAVMSGDETKEFGITQAIVDTRKQLAAGLDDEPKLTPNKVKMVFKFAVTRTGGPKGGIKFLVFQLGGGATVASAETSTITLTFGRAAP